METISVAREVAAAPRRPVPREIVGRGDQQAPARADAPDDQVLRLGAADAQSEIDIGLDQIDRAVFERQGDPHRGVTALEVEDDPAQMALPDADGAVDVQIARDRAGAAADILDGGVDGRERAARCLVERAPLLAEPHRAGASLQETRAHLTFEVAQDLADGGLRDAEVAGSRGHGAALDDADEDPQGGDGVHR